MKYVGSVSIRSSACQHRLRSLVEELRGMNCQTKVNRQLGRVDLAVPADLYSWIRAGGLAGLLHAYGDAIQGFPRFHESSRTG